MSYSSSLPLPSPPSYSPPLSSLLSSSAAGTAAEPCPSWMTTIYQIRHKHDKCKTMQEILCIRIKDTRRKVLYMILTVALVSKKKIRAFQTLHYDFNFSKKRLIICFKFLHYKMHFLFRNHPILNQHDFGRQVKKKYISFSWQTTNNKQAPKSANSLAHERAFANFSEPVS